MGTLARSLCPDRTREAPGVQGCGPGLGALLTSVTGRSYVSNDDGYRFFHMQASVKRSLCFYPAIMTQIRIRFI